MSQSLTQRDILLLPQASQADMLLTMLTNQQMGSSSSGSAQQDHLPPTTPLTPLTPHTLLQQQQQHQQQQQAPVPSPTRVTSTHMPSALCEKLIQLCNQYHVIISDNGNSMDCRMKRRNLWMEISRQLNSEFNVEFTADQYKKKYQNLKTALKTKMQNLGQPGTSMRTVSPDSRRDSQGSANSQTQPVTPIDVKQEGSMLQSSSPNSPVQAPHFNSSLASIISFQSTSPVRPTPQVPTTPLAGLFDKNAILALAVQAAQQQFNLPGLAGISPQIGGDMAGNLPSGSDMASLLAFATNHQMERENSLETSVAGPLHPLSVLRPISTGDPDRDAEHITDAPGSAIDSASVSDHVAPHSSSLPHISPQQEEDPARMFCLSLADPLRRIKQKNPVLYVELKRRLSTIVFDAEMDTVQADSQEPRTPTESDDRME